MSARSETDAAQGEHRLATRSAIDVCGAGHAALYAAAVVGFGALLVLREFVYVWAPIPRWVPGRQVIACASGAVMAASAIGLLWRRTVVLSSAMLTLVFLTWLAVLQLPRIVAAPSEELLWSGAGQIAAVVAGGWLLFASQVAPAEGPKRWYRGASGVRMARLLYAGALPIFGLHHFFGAAGAAQAVPAWIPFRPAWAYLTGAAHIVAGLALLLGIVPRLAATLEAIMVIAFVLLVHVPGTIDHPTDPLQWTMLVVALTIGGAGWIVARSYAGALRRR